MEHLIPYPNFRAADERNKVKQMEDYLYQLRETLELALTDIGPANFSAAFRMELQNIGMEMQNVQTNTEESQQRVERVSGAQITVSDVLNSEAYKASINAVKDEAEKSNEELHTTITKEIDTSNEKLHETITEDITAAKEDVSVVTTDSDITFPDGTRIEYGSASVEHSGEEAVETNVTFRREFKENPVVVVSPGMASVVTKNGFSVAATSGFTWIAIGK